jgi:hypothetical protein
MVDPSIAQQHHISIDAHILCLMNDGHLSWCHLSLRQDYILLKGGCQDT